MDLIIQGKDPYTQGEFRLDLSKLQDLTKFHHTILGTDPEQLSLFMHRMYCNRLGPPIDAIKDLYSQTPEHTEERRLLGDILLFTFEHARKTVYHGWKDTIESFATTDLAKLNDLRTALYDCYKDAERKSLGMYELSSRLGVLILSIDALEVLLRREEYGTPQRELRKELLFVARRLTRIMRPGLYASREASRELYHCSDLNGNTIAHHIAKGTLFPGSEQIEFYPFDDESILQLTNFEGRTVKDLYEARLYGFRKAPDASLRTASL